MQIQGIDINLNNTSLESFNKLNKSLTDRIFIFLRNINTHNVVVNSGYRNDTTSHKTGYSIDFHQIITPSKTYTFHYQNSKYNFSDNLTLFYRAKNFFGKNLVSWYSPERIYNPSSNTDRSNNKTDYLDKTHLDHLHIQLSKNYYKIAVASSIPILLFLIGFGLYLYKRK